MKTAQRTNLWFNRFDWCIKLHLPEAFVLRELDHARIDRIIKRRQEWARTMIRTQPGSWVGASWVKLQITDDQIKNLHDFCDFLLGDSRPRKLMLTGDWVYIYTTDQTLFDDLKNLPFVKQGSISVRHMRQIGDPGTLRLKKPNHAYRSYCRDMPLDPAQRKNLQQWLLAQSNIRMSSSLKSALDLPVTKRIFSYYFIDHDEHGSLVMLDLIVPNLIRRTLPIVADK